MDFAHDYMRALLAKEIDVAADCRSRDLRSFISSIAQVVRCIVATIVQV